jgi:hypothetical protein
MHFEGKIESTSLVNATQQRYLDVIDISDNAFIGSISEEIFNVANLTVFAAVKNCFNGVLPSNLCAENASASKTLKVLVLDGLHAADQCHTSLLADWLQTWTSTSAYTLSSTNALEANSVAIGVSIDRKDNEVFGNAASIR